MAAMAGAMAAKANSKVAIMARIWDHNSFSPITKAQVQLVELALFFFAFGFAKLDSDKRSFILCPLSISPMPLFVL